jgi:hypothetical protein
MSSSAQKLAVKVECFLPTVHPPAALVPQSFHCAVVSLMARYTARTNSYRFLCTAFFIFD